MLKKIGSFVLGMIVLFSASMMLVNALPDAVEKEQRRECLQWNAWAKERPAVFYLTPDQKERCDALKIEINAPVKMKKEGHNERRY